MLPKSTLSLCTRAELVRHNPKKAISKRTTAEQIRHSIRQNWIHSQYGVEVDMTYRDLECFELVVMDEAWAPSLTMTEAWQRTLRSKTSSCEAMQLARARLQICPLAEAVMDRIDILCRWKRLLQGALSATNVVKHD